MTTPHGPSGSNAAPALRLAGESGSDTPASLVADRLRGFGPSIFAQMTALANAHNAINLSQGFPDFDGPEIAKEAAIASIRAGQAQYARMIGVPPLNQAIARSYARRGFPVAIDPEAHVTVTVGCSEAIGAVCLGLLNPGDEVIVFEPYFDFYTACCAMAGATCRPVTLHAPREPGGAFWFDPASLEAAFTSRTKAIFVSTPHNPTGKVFTREELALIASFCERHNVVAISDEVYEDLWFDEALPHIHFATLPGMWERTITLSSLGKTFSLTGWKVGWSVAPPRLTACVRAAHQFMTFSGATPLQHAAAAMIEHDTQHPGQHSRALRELFAGNRDLLSGVLRSAGLEVYRSDGTYFLMADHSAVSRDLGLADDRAFCHHLTTNIGVAAIPPSVFYLTPGMGKNLVRFAFCKKRETMRAACERLAKL
jgi:aspartate/methionine/tyrosine aminotransferase